ncbi:tRNA (adenosine(37)-N6)-threonylcarbamoyltransferase complex ATPase subunit type 1 TsaE [Virgibacillus phasianinus]|uniref:tRNA threonylcarbamoyladenosine biosynthesis protein TsaE n=1 Tax=Virgibacillus phasianinus TaxID=2017483 RepID=A0A220TZN1_9BACI|nr:tRNA (adenosine(37)-N6)-threonylcarbamoyltransferase complex ATPase subunit type 1 TsaE [Virgibacillus phasianinus]ASK61240.1 tRNA (adenosine(37)-N6)-threonylcarbamoyltransferase complex ATPase subunit type 1 TsaE [Virgibacillus phasianinus]
MSEHRIETHTEEETRKIAIRLANLLRPGDVITLEGDLGAGKTTFTKGIATGLGVKRVVNSPTYTIIKEYEGELPLYHMDVYRLEDSDEDIGFSEYFDGKGISIVEWAQFIEEYLPEERLDIKISYLNEQARLIELFPKGNHFTWVVSSLIG